MTKDPSRRSFMKKLGLGMAAGIAATMPATSQLRITKNGIFNSNETTNSGGSEFVLEKRDSTEGDPTNPEVGQIWYRADKD